MASMALLAPQIRLTVGIPAQVDDLPHVEAIPRDTVEVNDIWGRGEVLGASEWSRTSAVLGVFETKV